MDFMPESTGRTSRDQAHQIITGKRTDHQRPCSSFVLVETTSSSYSGGEGCMSSEEEEDMANCLIMLAYSDKPDLYCQKTDKLKLRSVTEMTTTLGGNPGSHNYECKTCNRAFPSFQALGGHRASHKKPKLTIEDKNSVSIKTEFSRQDQPEFQLHYEENKVVTTSNNKKGKVHECSICGSEFLSGQALGGHMRRHRAPPPSTNQMNDTSALHSIEKSHVLSIDLNLPAPEVNVDDVHSNIQFMATSSSQQPLVFSAAALVDCHY